MRICLVSSFPPNRARLAEHSHYLALNLSREKSVDEIYVLADKGPSSKKMERVSEKILVERAWSPNDNLSIMQIPSRIAHIKPDIVHFNVHFQSFGISRISNFLGLSLPSICKILNFKTVVTIHNLGELIDLRKVFLPPSFFNRMGISFATRLISKADAVATTVKFYAEYLRSRYNARTVYIPHGTETALNCQDDPGHDGKFRILMFGHMSPYKGLDVALESYRRLKENGDGFELWVAGESHPNFPGFLEDYKKRKVDGVRYLGYTAEGDLPELFSNADVVILPYHTATGTSGVFNLACGFGKPVVASDRPEIKELLEEGASALIIPSDDIDKLSDALIRLNKDRGLLKEISAANRKFALEHSWTLVAQKYVSLYKSVIQNSG